MNLLLLAIDMVLVYLVFAILVSGIQEWIAQKLSKRGQFLQRGLLHLIGDVGIFEKVVAHPLIAGTSKVTTPSVPADGAQAGAPAKAKPPSYIDPENLALALSQVLLIPADPAKDPRQRSVMTFATLRDAIAQETSPVAEVLLPILDSSGQDLDKALEGIQNWFSRGMDRVSGWYKAYAQWRLFWIGLVVAVLANVNSIAIFEALNRSPELAGRVANEANAIVDGKSELTPEQSQVIVNRALAVPAADLPIGYGCLASAQDLGAAGEPQESQMKHAFDRCGSEVAALVHNGPTANLLLYLLGCSLTALAGTLGAPYWFAALADLLRIRGSGPTPSSRRAVA